MGRIVLVHGAWHGGWCWDAVAPALEAEGHGVRVSELHRGSLEGDVAAVQADVEALGGEVVACGHSYGGIVITGLRPDGLRHLVYLAALIPDADESAFDLGQLGPAAPLNEAIVFGPDGTCTVDPDRAADVFYGDCTEQDQRTAVGRLRPQSVSTLTATPPNVAWRDVPSTYVRCTLDRAIHPDLQELLARRVGAREDWPTSHSPFLSVPDRVVRLLSTLAS